MYKSSSLRQVKINLCQKRKFSSVSTANVIKITRKGPAEHVLKLETENLPPVQPNQVLVKMITASISPTDLSYIEGLSNSSLQQTVGGNEGYGQVVQVGSGVTDLKVQDFVIPAHPGLGTWRTHGVFDREKLDRVSKLNQDYGAVFSGAPTTAYRLLKDFVPLTKNDTLVQNAANSTVGLSVIQLANAAGIKTINIIRDRPNFAEVVELLKGLGGYMVVSESYAATPQFRRLLEDLPSPKLALNATGGPSATELARILGNNGTFVTYGGLSRKPVTIPTSSFLQKSITLQGFSLDKWVKTHSAEERHKMHEELIDMIRKEKLKLWLERWPFSKFFDALHRSKEPFRDRKVVLELDK